MKREEQLEQFDKAYGKFVHVVDSLSAETFLRSLGDWTPRDIVAHLIGWNRNIRVGCGQIRNGLTPFYHQDAPNDYRNINAEFITHYNSTDRGALLAELRSSRDELVEYVRGLHEQDWAQDFGPRHYRGGPATVERCIESIMGDYIHHTEEIARAAGS